MLLTNIDKQTVMRAPTRVKHHESEKHPFWGTPKKPEKGEEWIYRPETTNFYVAWSDRHYFM